MSPLDGTGGAVSRARLEALDRRLGRRVFTIAGSDQRILDRLDRALA